MYKTNMSTIQQTSLTVEQQAIAAGVISLLDIIPTIKKLERQLNDNPTNLTFMANTTFVTRKSVEIIKAIKKQLEELEDKVAEQACMVFAQTNIENHSTENCTVSPNAEFYVKYPAKPEDQGYVEFVQQLPPHCIRPHYPAIGEEIANRLTDGGPLPFGLNRELIRGTEFKLRMRGKKEL